MKKQIALLLSATLAISSFGFSAWAEEAEVFEPVLGGVEVVPPSAPVVEDVEIIAPDFVVDGEVIEIPVEEFESEETENVDNVYVEDDFSDIDLPEVGASSMLSGAGSEVIMGEETQNLPADDININVNFTDSFTGISSNSRTGTITYEQDAVLGSKVMKHIRASVGDTSFAGFYKTFSSAKKGRIHASVKVKVDDTTSTQVLPISFFAADANTMDFYQAVPTVYILEGKFRVPSFNAGSNGGGSSEVGTALSDQWYQIDIYANVDGNTSTTDTFDYEIYTLGANNAKSLTYSGKEVKFGNNIASGANRLQANAGISTIAYCMIAKNGWAAPENYPVPGAIWMDDANCSYAPAEAYSEVDGKTNINPGVSEIIVEFLQYMTTDTFQNITVTKADENPVTDVDGTPVTVTITPVNARKAKITFSEVIAGNTQYKITVPASVKTLNQESCTPKTINFGTSEYVYVTPVDSSVAFERKFDDNSMSDLGFVYAGEEIVTDTDLERGKVLKVKKNSAPDIPYTSYLSSAYYQLPTAQTGSIFMSVKFKVPDTSKWDFAPISFIGNKQSYYTSASFLRVNNGKFLENDRVTSPADVEANVWYQLDVTLFVDGKSTTTDSYSYTLKRLDGGYLVDDKTEITKENVAFGIQEYGGLTEISQQESVERVHFGMVSTYSQEYANEHEYARYSDDYFIDDISIKKFLSPSVTSTIANNATNVPINKEIKLTFDQKVDAADFTKIILKQGETVLEVTPSVTSGMVKSVTIVPKNNFDYNREYVLSIPKLKNQGGIPSLAQDITFITDLKPSNVGINTQSITKSTDGNTITIGATLVNNSMSNPNQASIITTLVGVTSGRVYDIGYKTHTISAGLTANTSVELTKPDNLSEAIKVVVYAFDTIKNMELATNPIDK